MDLAAGKAAVLVSTDDLKSIGNGLASTGALTRRTLLTLAVSMNLPLLGWRSQNLDVLYVAKPDSRFTQVRLAME